jgi:hypothetical protein
LKFDGSLHRSWYASLVGRTGPLIALLGHFEEETIHPLLGTILRGTSSTEYYWVDRWYSIFRFDNPDGTFRNFYCNINFPAVDEGTALSFIDLDIDLLVDDSGSVTILDEREFVVHSERYGYPASVVQSVYQARLELECLIRERQFPFDSLSHARGSTESIDE